MGNETSCEAPRSSYVAAMASVTKMEGKELFELREKWAKAMRESGHPTSVTREEYDRAIEDAGLGEADGEVLDRLFVMFDKMGDGVVNYREVVTGLSVLSTGTDFAKLVLAFELYDVQKTSKAKAAEVVFVLDAVNNMANWFGDPALSPEDVHSVVDDVFKDPIADDSGYAPFDAIIPAVLKHPLALQFLQADGRGGGVPTDPPTA